MSHPNPDLSRRAFLASASRSWPTRLALAFAVTALIALAGVLLWQGRGILAIGAILAVVFLGIGTVTDLLPWPDAMRARMARERARNARYPSYRFRTFLWIGLGMLAGQLARSGLQGPWRAPDFLVPMVFIVGGGLAMLVWKTKHSSE